MKNKVLAAILTITITIGSSMPAFATPSNAQLSDSRQKYIEIENRIKDIENKIYDLGAQIEPLQVTVDKNKNEIEKINRAMENTKKDIEQYKKEINELDLALGKRIKAVYTSGDLEFNYLNFLLKADSTSELVTRVQAVSKIVGKDKEAIENINNKKDELNAKVKSLDDKKAEINTLNKEIQEDLNQLAGKKKEQEELANQAKEERSKFDSEYLSLLERDAVKSQFDSIDNPNSSYAEVQGAINQLTSIRNNQIKSPIVTKEINDKIEKAKTIASKKKAAEEKEAAERAAREAQARASAAASNKSTSTNASTSSKKPNSSVSAPSGGSAQAVLNEAYKYLGTPYVWGATGPENFDCSGFTSYVYSHAAGIDISRTTYTQINVGQPVSQDQLKPGDLVFPNTGHVGIYVGNGQMIHAPQTGDVVKVGPVYNFYAARRIL